MKTDPTDPLPEKLLAALLGGTLGGLLLLATGLLRHGELWWQASPSAGFRLWILGHSIAVYGLLGALAGLGLGILYLGVRGRSAPAWSVGAVVLGLCLTGLLFAELSVRGQLHHFGGLPLSAPARRTMMLRHGITALAFGGLAVVFAHCWTGFQRHFTRLQGRTLPLLSLFLLGALVSSFAFSGRSENVGQPSRVVVVGLDGLTFRVLSPLLRKGETPTFARLLDEGAWGSFMTYGTASSPQVWTSLATGHRVRDHGIDDFVQASRGGYRAVPMKSFDRKTRAIWNLLGEAGHRLAVVNWLITFPPEEVNGYMVPRLNTLRRLITFPPTLAAELDDALPPPPGPEDRVSREHYERQILRTFETARRLLAREDLRFLALMNASADAAQHRLWRFYEPEAFSADRWPQDETPPTPGAAKVIPQVYRDLDQHLGRFLENLDEDTLVILVSDHGQGPAKNPRVYLRLDRLLVRLGWAQWQAGASSDQIDLARSRAYPLAETPWTPTRRLNLNLKGREPHGLVSAHRLDELREQLAEDLANLQFLDGTPFFGPIEAAKAADLRLPLSPEVRHGAWADREFLVEGQKEALRDYLEIDTSISGDHDHQGILFVHGPGVRRAYLGQRVVSTALQDIVWHLTDKVDAVDLLLPPMRWLGLLDRATTLDLTPTVLHALDMPVARDMEGRPLLETFEDPKPVQWIETYEGEGDESEGSESGEAEEDEEMMERLRSLGYIN